MNGSKLRMVRREDPEMVRREDPEAETELVDMLSGTLLQTKALMLKKQVSAFLTELEARDEFRSLDLDGGISLRDEVRRLEIGLIQLALKRSGGSQQRAARMLDIKPSTLCAKLKNYQILVEEARQ
jgi:DNA-binding NtrC family response regulator